MTKTIDFYFDFISPYSYIAYQKIKKINKKNDYKFNLKPILLGGLHNLGGIIAPAFNNQKLKNMKNDCELISKKNDFNFKWNDKFPINSLYLMRGYLYVNEKLKVDFFNICFDEYWKNNLDISTEESVKKICEKCKLNHKDFLDGINNQTIKEKLKIFTNDAFEKDIFGAPTFVVNKKIFWGQDRLEYALDESKN
jgi:2-hydroxychromene-2-carboxylate isomerase|tara:strand:+ start:41 stop:625 length:585 start_codon:yes stop_codon:yes gene_type:complete